LIGLWEIMWTKGVRASVSAAELRCIKGWVIMGSSVLRGTARHTDVIFL
jgi:hypothetical protein